jgi:Flp pilus assembly protein TadG
MTPRIRPRSLKGVGFKVCVRTQKKKEQQIPRPVGPPRQTSAQPRRAGTRLRNIPERRRRGTHAWVLTQTLQPLRMRSKMGPASISPPRSYLACRAIGPGGEEGQATLEMVVSLTVIFSLVFWLFELCMFTYTCSVLNDAAQEGVRYAIMHGTDSSACSGPDTVCTNQAPYSNVQAVVTAAASASLHNTSAMTVTVSYANSTAATGNPVAVRVAYTYVPYLNFPGLANALTFTSQGQILY